MRQQCAILRQEARLSLSSHLYFEEVYAVKSFGGFCLIKYANGDGGYRVKESRLFATEEETKASIDKKK